MAPFIAEFSGTFILVFTIACCKYHGDSSYGIAAIGFTYMVLIYSLLGISGGLLNPCVTLMMALNKKLGFQSVLQSFSYIVSQLLGGIAGGFVSRAVFKKELVVGPIPPFNMGGAMWMEFLYTTLLCFVAANVVASKRNNPKEDQNQFYALAIAFSFIAGGYSSCDISGAYFNPAVVLGLDPGAFGGDLKAFGRKLIALDANFSGCLPFIIAEVLAAIAAALLFFFLRFEDYLEHGHPLQSFAPPRLIRVTVEFLGTCILVLTFGLSGSTTAPIPAAVPTAATLACLIYALGNVSGGHFNPAVTLAVRMRGRDRCSDKDCAIYIIVQLTASVIAALVILRYHHKGPSLEKIDFMESGWCQVFVSELAFTFLLAYVVLCVATLGPLQNSSTKQNFFFAFAIGSCVAVAGIAIGRVSGAFVNPGVSLALTLESSMIGTTDDLLSKTSMTPAALATISSFWKTGMFTKFIWYSFSEFAGAILAALAFRITHRAEFEKHSIPLRVAGRV